MHKNKACIKWAFNEPTTKSPQRLMLLAIASYCNSHGTCHPSIETLARKCGVNYKNANKHIKALESRGLIGVVVGGGRDVIIDGKVIAKTNLYVMIGYRKDKGLDLLKFNFRTPIDRQDQ